MSESWRSKIVSPEEVIRKIQPGDSIFLSTGTGEPRALIQALLTSDEGNVDDLELIQLVSVGDTVNIEEKYPESFRLKTFFSGWVAYSAIAEGRVDLIPCRFSRIPHLISSGALRINVAFVQISPPYKNGYASLGLSVDAARKAMDHARLVVGEINPALPRSLGDTLVHVDDFQYLVESNEPLIEIPRPRVDPVFEALADRLADVIEDGSCLVFSMGQMYEALAKRLQRKHDLGIHSAFITDAVMDLIESGAVTNQRKGSFKGKSVVSYAFGTNALYSWLNMNPQVEFQGIDVVTDPQEIGRQDRFVFVSPARQVDLTGEVAFHTGRGRISAGPGESQDYVAGVYVSRGGKLVAALPSRNRQGESNVLVRLTDYRDTLAGRNAIDFVVTEHGVAALQGKSVRERALALISIAHPDFREQLFREAFEAKYIRQELTEVEGRFVVASQKMKTSLLLEDGTQLNFRPVHLTDEPRMRDLLYALSQETLYYRFMTHSQRFGHKQIQNFVYIDHRKDAAIVGTVPEAHGEEIIAIGRYYLDEKTNRAEVAFIVRDEWQNKRIGSFLFKHLVTIAKRNGIGGFSAEVLRENKRMQAIFLHCGFTVKSSLEEDVYSFQIDF